MNSFTAPGGEDHRGNHIAWGNRLAAILRRLTLRRRCPACDLSLRSFRPLASYYTEQLRKHGFPHRLEDFETLNTIEYQCPSCGSSDRDRLYVLHLESEIAAWKKERPLELVHFSPSRALRRWILRQGRVSYRSADLSRDDVDDRVDLLQLPYPDASFDAFICSHVLEHVEDDVAAMGELYRILRPGGWGILMVPILTTASTVDEDPTVEEESERWRRFAQGDHLRLYSGDVFRERARNAGFQMEALGADQLGRARFRRHGITPGSVLHLALRQGAHSAGA